MHILTKAFMVLATLLSVALSALVIAYAANTDRISRDYNQVKMDLATNQAASAGQTSSSALHITRLDQQIADLLGRNTEMSGKLTQLQDERAQLQREKEVAVADRTTSESKISQFTEMARTTTTLMESYRTEVTTLRKNELTYKQRQLEMEDRLNDLQAQRDVLDQNYRALQEELAALKQGTSLAAGASGAPNAPFVYTGPVIRGRVEGVQADAATNTTLAKLSVGTNDRVAKNMVLRIIRDNQFIANVVVTSADLSYSVGTIDMVGKTIPVREGDTVVSRLQ